MSNEKRKKLIEAAKQLFVAKGYQATTLAMIAQSSGVPLGNVYYYFKSKEAFMDAVIRQMDIEIQDEIEQMNNHDSPQARLKSFIDLAINKADSLVRYGDSLLNIAKETAVINDQLRQKSSSLGQVLHNWLSQQFAYIHALDGHKQARLFLQRFYGIISLSLIGGNSEELIESLDALKKHYHLY